MTTRNKAKMCRKVTIFLFVITRKIQNFMFLFYIFILNCCISVSYANDLKPIYQKLFSAQNTPKEIEQLWKERYPFPQDTLLYSFLAQNKPSEHPLSNFYNETQSFSYWLLGIFSLFLIGLYLLIIPLLKKSLRLLFYTFILCVISVVVYQYRYYLFQRWVAIPTRITLYESPSFADVADFENTFPMIGIVVDEHLFWQKIYTERGMFWVPNNLSVKL